MMREIHLMVVLKHEYFITFFDCYVIYIDIFDISVDVSVYG